MSLCAKREERKLKRFREDEVQEITAETFQA